MFTVYLRSKLKRKHSTLSALSYILLATCLLLPANLLAANETSEANGHLSAKSHKPIIVAVASNFTAPIKAISKSFEDETGYKVKLALGSSGKLYSQIRNMAPFHIFLSADQTKPALLEQDSFAVPGSRFTYATGTLALWSPRENYINEELTIMKSGSFSKLAIANPKTAPYGAAALQTIEALELSDVVLPKLIRGENVAQTFQFVWSGNADIGFIALSQIKLDGKLRKGSVWIVPEDLHTPIRQDAQLLSHGRDNSVATAFLAFLKSEKAISIMSRFGYQH